jgi:cytochrome oxidase Cu insertion factor (SCO1/SenC/PrrC family)
MRRVYLIKGALVAAIVIAGLLIAYSTTRSHDSAGVAATPAVPPSPYRGSKPPPGVRAPNFELRSYRGQLVRMRDLRGKVVLITFIDTACTDKCPIIASQVAAALPLLPSSARRQVVALALTVDPRVDSPRSVRRFLAQRHATSLDFLLGTVKELRPIWKAFYVVAAPETGNSNVHSADARIFDRRGIWVSTLRPGVDMTPSNVAHDLLTALKRTRGRS